MFWEAVHSVCVFGIAKLSGKRSSNWSLLRGWGEICLLLFLFWVGCDGLLSSVGEPSADFVKVSGKAIATPLCLAVGYYLRRSLRRAAVLIWIPVAPAAMVKPVNSMSIVGAVALGEVGAVSTTSFSACEDEFWGMWNRRPTACTGAASVTGTRWRDRQWVAEPSISPGAAWQSMDINEQWKE